MTVREFSFSATAEWVVGFVLAVALVVAFFA